MTGTISFFIIGVLILSPGECWGLGVPGDTKWWENALFFEAPLQDRYRTSFSSLRDLEAHLVTIKLLGANAVCLGPIFRSDNDPYRTVNYTDVDTRLGSMNDFTDLVYSARSNGLKIILDVVPFFTSDEHRWFEQWKANMTPWNQFYVEPSKPPGPYIPQTHYRPRDWCVHASGNHAPDLNCSNQNTVDRINKDIFEYWLDRGVDGFRILGLPSYFSDDVTNYFKANMLKANKKLLSKIRKRVDEWTIKNNAEPKYLAVQTLRLEKGMTDYNGTDGLSGVMPLNNPLYAISDGNGYGNVSLKNFILGRLNTIPTNASFGWMLSERYGRGIRWSVGKGNMDAIKMLLMLSPGHGYIHAVNELNMGDSSDNDESIGRDHTSHICRFKRITELRRLPVFEYGESDRQALNNDSVLVLRRNMSGDPSVYVAVINLEDHGETINLTRLYPDLEEDLDVLVNTDPNETTTGRIKRRDSVRLSPNSGTVLRSIRRKRASGSGESIEWPAPLKYCNEPDERDRTAGRTTEKPKNSGGDTNAASLESGGSDGSGGRPDQPGGNGSVTTDKDVASPKREDKKGSGKPKNKPAGGDTNAASFKGGGSDGSGGRPDQPGGNGSVATDKDVESPKREDEKGSGKPKNNEENNPAGGETNATSLENGGNDAGDERPGQREGNGSAVTNKNVESPKREDEGRSENPKNGGEIGPSGGREKDKSVEKGNEEGKRTSESTDEPATEGTVGKRMEEDGSEEKRKQRSKLWQRVGRLYDTFWRNKLRVASHLERRIGGIFTKRILQ